MGFFSNLLDKVNFGLNLDPFGFIGDLITNKTNQDNVNATNATNKEIAQQNIAFQNANLDYQKKLQQQIFEREDSSYQRTVEDMRKSGMSPLSMSGTNGAGSTIATTAQNNSYVETPFQAQTLRSMASAQLELDKRFELEKMQALANVAKTNAETSLITNQRDSYAREFEHRKALDIYDSDNDKLNTIKQVIDYLSNMKNTKSGNQLKNLVSQKVEEAKLQEQQRNYIQQEQKKVIDEQIEIGRKEAQLKKQQKAEKKRVQKKSKEYTDYYRSLYGVN